MRYWIFFPAFIAVACAANANRGEKPFRSPTHDYDPPTATAAADGEVIGADQMRPADKLATSPRVGTEGLKPTVKPAARPTGVESETQERERTQRKLCQGSEVMGSDNRCQTAPAERR